MPHQCTNCGRTFADGSKEMLSGCPDCSGTKFQFRPEGFDGDSTGNTGTNSGDVDPATNSGDADSATTNDGAVDRTDAATTDSGADSVDDLSTRGDTVSRTVGSAAATVRDLVGGSAGPDATAARPPGDDGSATPGESTQGPTEDGDDDIIVAEPDPGSEDAAQADARSGFATADELPGESERDDTAEPDAGDGATQSASFADPASGTEHAAEPEPGEDPEAGDDPDGRTAVSEPDAETADRPDMSELRKELNEQFESIRVVEPGQYELNLMELYDREEYIIALQEDGRYSIQVPETWRDADD